MSGTFNALRERARQVQRAYAGDADRPLAGYLGAIGVYTGGIAAAAGIGRLCGVRLPVRVAASDIALVGIATHKLSRMVAKDPILSPLRAPFTKYEGTSGESELAESVRGTGAQHAVGELISCPFCVGQWVATAFVGGLVLAPRVTRATAAVFATKAIADAAQLVYDAVQKGSAAMPAS